MSACVANLSGIGSILGSDCEMTSKTAPSLRRTLSAEFSSKKWLTQQGFSPLKKIASSKELQIISELDMWNSEDNKKDVEQPPQNFDVWSSIVSQKSPQVIPPYVHPLTKSSRSLSQKSLEICTENLGCETGSDGFSSYSPSEASSDGEQDEQVHEEMTEKEVTEEPKFVSFNSRKSSARSFPPPLPSLSLHMRSHRQDGRLVLEAIPTPVSSQNNFQAQRQDGRLLLTFINSSREDETITHSQKIEENYNNKQEEQTEKYQEKFEDEEEKFEEDDNYAREEENEDEEDQEEEEEDEEELKKTVEEKEEKEIVFGVKDSERKPKVAIGVINVHRSALLVNKLLGLSNRDPTAPWSSKLQNKNTDETPLPQSLPSPPPPRIAQLIPAGTTATAAAASFNNTYEYCWRNKNPSAIQYSSPLTRNKGFFTKNINPRQEHHKLVPISKGCNEPRRSLLIWEPCCIASS